MADRQKALAVVLANEGFYSNNSADPGGETLYGIARRAHPEWPGWTWVDTYRRIAGQAGAAGAFPENMRGKADLLRMAGDFHLGNFWRFDGVRSDDVATKLFDRAVNHGLAGAVREAQQGLQRLVAGPVVVDGKWGPNTEALVNAVEPEKLLPALRVEWLVTEMREIAGNPALLEFARGWIRRALQ
jgi:lysozyme family protein